jgi:predicted TIM-barrel fold metal-dependent hydrolase
MLPPDTKVMSADDHLIEPANLWLDHIDPAFLDRAPRIHVDENGREYWLYEDERYYTTMGSCRPLEGHPETGYPPAPGTANYDEIRPGCYDPVERLKDMDVDGVWAQLCFPNYARFAGHRFYLGDKDLELGEACIRAYNDHLLDVWCATDPERLHGAVILPLADVGAAVAELERVIPKGASAIAFSENPTVLGLPSVHTEHWDPLFALAEEAGVPICQHIGSSSKLMSTSPDAPTGVMVTLLGINSVMAGVDWMLGTTLDRFPDLNVILSEGGAGWVPYIVERADKVWHDKRINPSELGFAPKGTRPPSEIFAQHINVCLVDEHFALRAIDDIPVDNLLWEGDYPHGDGLWPNNRTYLEKAMADVPDDVAVKIASTNLQRLLAR